MSQINNGRLISAATILGIASLVSAVVGLLRDRVLATTFGAGDVLDAYAVAFRLPDLIFSLLVLGALSAAFIPLFTEKLVKGGEGKQKAFDFALPVLNVLVLVAGGLALLFVIFAPYLILLIAPGFEGEKLQMTITLARIMALQPVLLAVSAVFSGILNSFKRFVVYALAPILYNVGIIFGVLLLVPRWGVVGLAWGVVLGAGMHMLIQLPSVIALGFRWRPKFNWARKDVRALWCMMVPRVVGLAATQVNLLTVSILGSSLLAGSIAVFRFANNVQLLPVGIFGIAFAQAAFPTLAEQVAQGRHMEFRNTLTRVMRYILFFVVPASLFFFLLRAQMIRVMFGAGAFDWEDTILTFETFGWLIVSIFAQALIPLLAKAFYVQKNTKTPVIISVGSMVLNVVLAVWLAPSMGVQGLALAFSVSAIVNVFLLLGVLHWQLNGLNDREVLTSLARIALAAMVAGIVVQVLKYPVAALVNMHRFWGIFVQLVVAGGGGGLAYLVLMWMLGSEELAVLRRYLPRRATVDLPPGTDTPRFEGLPD
ncbi:MAG: murein biosynthesis integral membrane protein MurJ [bacterium]